MASFSQRLHDVLSPFVESGKVAGVVASVSDANGLLAEVALGYADIGVRRKMTQDSIFWIASQTKPITATAIMMLVDDGLVNLDEPAEVKLPELLDLWVVDSREENRLHLARPARSLTLRDLLTHTSGMPFASKVESPTLDRLPLENAVYSYAATPLDAQPGVRYAYSNAGINTAARVLEVATGQPYEDFLLDRLLSPLEMDDTTFWPNAGQLSRLSKVYGPSPEGTGFEEMQISQLTYPLSDTRRFPMPAGGLFSTAADVSKFCRMVLNDGVYENKRYLSERSVHEMTTRQTAENFDGYGLGWGVSPDSYGHAGACATAMTIYPGIGRISLFLVQHAGYVGGECGIRELFEQVVSTS